MNRRLLSLLPLTLGLTLLLAFVSWELIERPALRLRRRGLAVMPSPVQPEAMPMSAAAPVTEDIPTPQTTHDIRAVAKIWRPAASVRRLQIAEPLEAAPSPAPAITVPKNRLALATQRVQPGRL